jgi:hypothetical protein
MSIGKKEARLNAFLASNANCTKFRVFWDVAPCSHVEVDRRFRGAYCLHHRSKYSELHARRRENMKSHVNCTLHPSVSCTSGNNRPRYHWTETGWTPRQVWTLWRAGIPCTCWESNTCYLARRQSCLHIPIIITMEYNNMVVACNVLICDDHG